MKIFLQVFKLFIFLTILTGVFYPVMITLLAQTVFPQQANGSLATLNGNVIGSFLLAQKFENSKYFWSRPSAVDYNPIPSGASNLGPTSGDLKKLLDDRKSKLLLASGKGPLDPIPVPQELFTASGSGLDPHISRDGALFQVARVVKARQFGAAAEKKLLAMVDSLSEKRDFGIFGESRVNVLKLNMALDRLDIAKEDP